MAQLLDVSYPKKKLHLLSTLLHNSIENCLSLFVLIGIISTRPQIIIKSYV